MEHAAETKHQQALEKVRGEVAAREREAFDEQKALLANERQEALSRYVLTVVENASPDVSVMVAAATLTHRRGRALGCAMVATVALSQVFCGGAGREGADVC